jgi:hypothetical protein
MITEKQQEFAHWFGLIAGSASILAFLLAIRANIKLNGHHKKRDEPLLRQQLLGSAPVLDSDGLPKFPVKMEKPKPKFYVFARLPYCNHDDEAVDRVTRAIGKKVGDPYELCDWGKNSLFLVYPNPEKAEGVVKKEAQRLAKRALKEVGDYRKGRVAVRRAAKDTYKYLGIRHGKT